MAKEIDRTCTWTPVLDARTVLNFGSLRSLQRNRNLPARRDDKLVKFFHRHVVPIYFAFKKGDRRSCCLVTSFVMSVHNQWFLMTAGHCIKDIEQNLRAGYAIERCRLVDCVGIGARH